MNLDLQEKLIKKYPEIFKINVPAKYPFDQRGFENWDGLYDLIDKTAAKIQFVLDKDDKAYFYTAQVKVKLARLTWYYQCDEDNQIIFNTLIDAAEKASLTICEKCGTKEDVTQNQGGYILTLCPSCRKKIKNNKLIY